MARNLITIEALETLDAIERRGSFSKAAEELNKATSAVSYTVQKLEEQLDITLFQRQGRRSVLTAAGRLILTEGRHILESTARLANKAKEVATGWETRISIGFESIHSTPRFFRVVHNFLLKHASIEIDVCECVLNGGWESLEQGRVDLIVGSPGPVPQQKGYRALAVPNADLVLVVSANHEHIEQITSSSNKKEQLTNLRRVITHDTSITEIARSAGLSRDGRKFYVQNIDQKVEAICAGIGIGHLPRDRVQRLLDRGELLTLGIGESPEHESFIAWKISNRGKGLAVLVKDLIKEFGDK